MFYTENRLQFPVRVETPNPLFARALQQAIGGVEGDIRVAMQHLFQAWGARGNPKFRDLLLDTGVEELGHIEMLTTAVALNLEGAPLSLQEEVSADQVGGAVLNGINLKNLLSSGLSAMPVDALVRPLKEESGTALQVGSTFRPISSRISAGPAPQQAPRGKANDQATSA